MKHILIIFFLVTFTFANIGKISTVVGDANIQRDNKSIIATVGLILKEKDIINTKRNAKVQLIFKDNTVVTLGKNSSLDINEYLYDEKNPKNSKTNLNFFKGAFKTITGKIGKINREKFKLRTKNATVGIRGTIILGNQQVIACTQGGITVQSSGQFVQVDANELTIIKENQAPSKPKNITSNELTSLENQLEPDSQTQDSSSSSSSEEKEEGDNNSSESKAGESSSNEESSSESQSNEETSNNTDKNESSSNKSQNDQKTSSNNENTQESENSNENEDSQFQNSINDSTNTSNSENSNVLQNEDVSSNTLQTQNALEGDAIAEGTAEEVAAQKQAEEQKVFVETTEEIKVATQEINDLKKNVQTAQEETTKTLETLPSTEQVTTLQTSSTTALTETKQEVNTAVDTLKEALNLNTLQSASTFSRALFSFSSLTKSSNSETKTPAQLEVEAQKALKDITDFIATQDSTKNQVALTSAKTKVDNAELLLKDSEAKLESAKTALQNAQNKGINSSLIDSIQKEVDSAQAAYDEVNTLYTNAKDLYDSKVKALNDLDTSLTTAEEAVKQAKLLVEVDNMKTSLTSIKNANTNANTNKDLTKATSTESSLSIQNLTKNSDILSIKTKTDNAQTTTNNSVNTALSELDNAKTNNITDETLANISSLVTQTNNNNSLLSEANAIKSDVATSENLALLKNAENKLITAAIQLENTKTNFKLAENELAEIKKSLKVAKKNDTNSLITNEINETVLSKAQADYDSALAARTQAQSAYDSANAIHKDRDDAYNNAVVSVNSAQKAVNDAVLLGKLSELLTFMDNGNDSNLQTSNHKTNVINSKNETSTIVNTLPTEQEINNVKTNASNALNQTDSSISNALTLLTNSTNNSNVDATDISSLNSSASSTTTSNNSILSSTQTFKNSVENEYTVSLNNAQVKATLSAQQLAQTKTALDNTKKALTDFNNSITSNSSTFDGQLSASLQTSLKEKLENEVAQAQASYNAALIASNEAQALVEAKRIALNDAVNISIENAQEAVQKSTTLEKLADMLEFVDNGNKASLNANTHKTITQTLINEAKVKINTLPTTDEINTVVSKSSSSLSGTNTTQTSLVTAINSAINSSNINSEALENLQEEVSSRRLLNNSALQEANTFKTKVEGEYKTILDEANLKVQSAYTSLENAEVELNNAIDAYDDMFHSLITLISGQEFDPSEETIPEIEGEVIISNNTTSEESEGPVNNSVVSDSLADSLMAKLQSEVNKAKDAYDEAREAYENVKEDYDNKVLALNNAAQQSVNEAQESVDTLVLLDNLEDVLDALEGSKQAQLDVENEKFNAVTAKTNTDTAASNAQSLASNVDTYYNDAKNASTESSSASTNALNAYNIAGNSETEDVDIAYSVQTYKDQTSLARLKANLAKTNSDNAESEYNKVVAKIDDVKDFLNNSLGARDNAITKLDLLKAKLDSLKEIEQQIPTSATAAKQSAQDAITKAEALYTIALAHKNDAVSAYNQAKEIFDELDKDTLLANAKTAKDNAKQEYDDANSDATNVEDKFATAIQYAKDASFRVKVVLLSKVKKAYPAGQSETTLDLPNKVFELSGVKTNEKLAPSAIMNYKGHTQLGVFKDNENSSNAMFLVQADNLHEYFVGYSDPSNVNKTLFIYGSNDADNFLTSKVYVYKNFKTFKNDTNKFLGKENSRAYYNSALNSFTVMSNDIYKTGATKFVVGNKNTVNTIEQDVKFKSGSNTFIDGVDVTQGNGQNTFQGSVEQGLTQTVNNTKEDSSTFDEISASFLDTVSDAKTTSVNKVLQGQTSMISLSSGVTGLRNEEIELFISSNGNMIGGESNYSNGNVIMEFFGTTNTQTSYYINTDIWGVRQNPVEVTGKDKEGYLMAVPDGAYNSMGEFVLFDENDNPLTSDDDSSWGYWSGKDVFVDNGHNASISPKSTWVAGVRTATSDVQSIIDGVSQTLTFNGKVMGTIGVNDAILMDNTNKVKIDFEVGAGTKNMSGNMQFKSANSSLYNLDMVINSDDITTSGFAGKFQNAGTGTGNKGYLSGEYYGEGTIKSVGGSFQVDDARGVFKATKK